MSKLLDFYESLMAYCNLKVNPATGSVYSDGTGKKTAILIEDKELVLPYPSVLSSSDIADKVVFHPIPEHVARGESPIIKKLLHLLSIQINVKASYLFLIILTVLHDAKSFKKLSPEQLELVGHLGSIDKTGLTNLHRLVTGGLKKDASRSLVKIFLRKGAMINEQRFARGGIVTFPMADEISNQTELKLRDKDIEAFGVIFETIFPGYSIKNKYSRGSNNDYIPYLEALLLSSLALVDPINTLIEMFPEKSDEMDMETFDISFADFLNENLNDLIEEARRIPSQPGNMADHVLQPSVPQAPVMQNALPSQQVPASVINSDNTVDINRLYMSRMGMNPGMMQPMQPVQPVLGNIRNTMMNTQPMYGMGGYNPMMMNNGYNPMMNMPAAVNPMQNNPMYPGQQNYAPVVQQPINNPHVNTSGRSRF